jgi:hypothetical protein
MRQCYVCVIADRFSWWRKFCDLQDVCMYNLLSYRGLQQGSQSKIQTGGDTPSTAISFAYIALK